MGLADWFRATFPETPLEELGKGSDGFTHYQIPAKLTPRLAVVREAPAREEWAAWRDDPTTVFVMAALKRLAEECQEQWMLLSWEGGQADQRKLDAYRERSDALLGFAADYEAFCETLGLEPVNLNEEEA